jgi:hypothetical protein
MVGWETDTKLADRSPLMRDSAEIWQATHKFAYSKTLEVVSTARRGSSGTLTPERSER